VVGHFVYVEVDLIFHFDGRWDWSVRDDLLPHGNLSVPTFLAANIGLLYPTLISRKGRVHWTWERLLEKTTVRRSPLCWSVN
jgi:hypothetical protein